MTEDIETDGVFELGTWLGHKQAFGLIAGQCSAADAECLRLIRQKKLYRALQVTWEEFCRQYVGISRATVDKTIRDLEHFGPQYFHLAAVARITPANYRQIAAAVTEQGVCCDGQTIPIEPKNAPRLTRAIEILRERASPPAEREEAAGARMFERAEKRLRAAVAELERLWALDLEPANRFQLRGLAAYASERLSVVLLSGQL